MTIFLSEWKRHWHLRRTEPRVKMKTATKMRHAEAKEHQGVWTSPGTSQEVCTKISLWALQRNHFRLTLWFQTSSLWSCERINLWFWGDLVWVAVLQQSWWQRFRKFHYKTFVCFKVCSHKRLNFLRHWERYFSWARQHFNENANHKWIGCLLEHFSGMCMC